MTKLSGGKRLSIQNNKGEDKFRDIVFIMLWKNILQRIVCWNLISRLQLF